MADGRASEALLLEWPRLALRFGRVKKALEAAARACQSRPGSAPLWQQRLLLEAQQASAQVQPPMSFLSRLLTPCLACCTHTSYLRVAAFMRCAF